MFIFLECLFKKLFIKVWRNGWFIVRCVNVDWVWVIIVFGYKREKVGLNILWMNECVVNYLKSWVNFCILFCGLLVELVK